MKIIYKKEHIELTFTWKEILRIIFKKHIKLNKKSCYTFGSLLMNIVCEMTNKYGDAKKHGMIESPVEGNPIDL
jgi:hypothetical protein